MATAKDIQHSLLIVSASAQFDSIVKNALAGKSLMAVDVKKSVSVARRCVLERYYDIVVINSPLPDETGVDFALDVTNMSRASILIVAARENYEDILERVTDMGILVLSKPFPRGRMSQFVRFLMADQGKIRLLEKKILSLEEKLEETRLVDKAKLILIQKERMSEDEAHRFIGKQAMDNGISRRRAAEMILGEED